MLNDSKVLKLILDPKDILIPPKYKNKGIHYDIALIGFSRENK